MNWVKGLFTRRRMYGEWSEEIRAHLERGCEICMAELKTSVCRVPAPRFCAACARAQALLLWPC